MGLTPAVGGLHLCFVSHARGKHNYVQFFKRIKTLQLCFMGNLFSDICIFRVEQWGPRSLVSATTIQRKAWKSGQIKRDLFQSSRWHWGNPFEENNCCWPICHKYVWFPVWPAFIHYYTFFGDNSNFYKAAIEDYLPGYTFCGVLIDNENNNNNNNG